jgi:hypothetical protein
VSSDILVTSYNKICHTKRGEEEEESERNITHHNNSEIQIENNRWSDTGQRTANGKETFSSVSHNSQ